MKQQCLRRFGDHTKQNISKTFKIWLNCNMDSGREADANAGAETELQGQN